MPNSFLSEQLETARKLSLQTAEERRFRQEAEQRGYHQALAFSQQSAAADQIRVRQQQAREAAETRDMSEALRLSFLEKGKGRQRKSSAERREEEELAAVLALSTLDTGGRGGGGGWESADGFGAEASHAVFNQAGTSPPRRVSDDPQRRVPEQRFYVANPDEPEPTPPAYEAVTLAPLPDNPTIIGPGRPVPSFGTSSPESGPSHPTTALISYTSPSLSNSGRYQHPIAAAMYSSSPDNRSWGHGDGGVADDEGDPFDEQTAAVGHLVRSPAGPRPEWARTDSDAQTESDGDGEVEDDEQGSPLEEARPAVVSPRETMDLFGLTHRDTLTRRHPQHQQQHTSQPYSDVPSPALAEPIADQLETPTASNHPTHQTHQPAIATSIATSITIPTATIPPLSATNSPSPSSSVISESQPRSPRLFDPSDVPNSGGLVDTSSAFPPEERVLDGVKWGFVSGTKKAQHLPLDHAGAFPDVAQLSRENDEYASFVFEAPSWGKLLIYLCWFGNARVEASPTDLQKDKAGRGLDGCITVDVFRSYAQASQPRIRCRVDLLPPLHNFNPATAHYSAEFDDGCPNISIPLPQTRRLPLSLAAVAEALSMAHASSRRSHHDAVHYGGRRARDLARAVDLAKRMAGEEVGGDEDEVEAEQNGIKRMMGRLKRLRMKGRGAALVRGGADGTGTGRPLEATGRLPEGALMITPFSMEGQ